MTDPSLEEKIRKICEKTGKSKDEVWELILEKRKELNELVSEDGAAHIVAQELGVDILGGVSESLKMGDLVPGLSNITVEARIMKIYAPVYFVRSDGGMGVVVNALLADNSGKAVLVLWNEQVRRIENFERGDIVRIVSGVTREGRERVLEIHLGSSGSIEHNPEDVEVSKFPDPGRGYRVVDLDAGMRDIDTVGKVTEIGKVSNYTKKDGSMGRVASIRIGDETGIIRVTFWDERVDEILDFKEGVTILIEGGYTRSGLGGATEIHVGKRTRVSKTDKIVLGGIVEFPETSMGVGQVKVCDLKDGMNGIELKVKVLKREEERVFHRKDGSSGQVLSTLVGDDTGVIKATVWGDKIGEFNVREGNVVVLKGGYVREGFMGLEVRVGGRCEIEVVSEDLDVEPLKMVKIGEIGTTAGDVNLKGRVVELYDVREFVRADGSEGKVFSLKIGDETGVARLVAWGEWVNELLDVKEGDILELNHGYMKSGTMMIEVHLGDFSEIRRISEGEGGEMPGLEELISRKEESREMERGSIAELSDGILGEIRGTLIRAFDRSPIYLACDQCFKKVEEGEKQGIFVCREHGEVLDPNPRMLFAVVVDDGRGRIRAIFTGDVGERLLGITAKDANDTINKLQSHESLLDMIKSFIGKELIFRGRVKKNKQTEELEFFIIDYEEVNTKDEINRFLEKLDSS
ncbi:MAG: OB-fold nucleic acid binding domain-containing protein [Candidatus Wukongarchaeota archaeon]|nr:OB-fold nucleic acid binding domain-containing protein [Candidatus Wukongarchaeota archaeon]